MHEISSKVRIEARGHAAAERSMLSQYVTDDNAAPTAHAVDRVLDALWEMLEGLANHMLFCNCRGVSAKCPRALHYLARE